VLNVKLLVQCIGISLSVLNIWHDEKGEVIIMPAVSNETMDYNLLLNCLEEQDIDHIVSVSDGTFVEDWVQFDQHCDSMEVVAVIGRMVTNGQV